MALQSTTALATVTLQAASSTVTFSGIPNTYRDLVLSVTGTGTGVDGNIVLRFNSDSGNNYFNLYMLGTGSSALSSTINSTSYIYGGGLAAGLGLYTWQILDYSATDKHKTTLNRSDVQNDATYAWAGRWGSLSAINTVTVSAVTFAIGTTFSLYGRIA